MELEAKLDLLAPAARFDVCDNARRSAHNPSRRSRRTHAFGTTVDEGNSRSGPVLRILMSSACDWNCTYCPLRAAADTPRASLEPEELVHLFLPRYQARAVQGLFLSTSVERDVPYAVGRMLDGIELLRTRYQYDGYVHVKLLPGTAPGDIERAARLANRLSLNLEAPGPTFLARISPERNWQNDLLERLRQMHTWQQAGLLASGIATQFVAGVAGEQDRDLLHRSTWLYNELHLRRVYYGAFRPVTGTPMAGTASTPPVRVQRLYQADWLLRHYGFDTAELPFDATGHLPLHLDPKLAWALAHPECFPVELNQAPPEVLLRVPGFGPVSVRRIMRLRRLHPFREVEHLTSLSTQASRARDFVTLDGHFFGREARELRSAFAPREPIVVEQLRLWNDHL